MEPTQEFNEPKEPSLDDVGTRFDHLNEYKESLEICINMLKEKGKERAKIEKLEAAYEVLTVTLDAFSGYREKNTEYSIYKLVNSVPKTKEQLIALGGKPLND